MSADAGEKTFDYVDELPRIAPGEGFCFRCFPGVSCFNACCQDLDLVLSPYDVLRLRRSLKISGDLLIQRHAEISPDPSSGLPLLYLKMRQDGRCPFVTAEGCRVYSDRPGPCRTYPLGRGTSLSAQGGVLEQYVVVREEHCRGFEEREQSWTIDTWLQDQEIEPYNHNNDRFLRLVDAFGRCRDPLRRSLAVPVVFALYQLDRLPDRIKKDRLFEKLEVPMRRRGEILADEVAALDFAIDWALAVLAGRV